MKICIVVKGGMVESVFTDNPDAVIEVEILDLDSIDDSESDYEEIQRDYYEI